MRHGLTWLELYTMSCRWSSLCLLQEIYQLSLDIPNLPYQIYQLSHNFQVHILFLRRYVSCLKLTIPPTLIITSLNKKVRHSPSPSQSLMSYMSTLNYCLVNRRQPSKAGRNCMQHPVGPAPWTIKSQQTPTKCPRGISMSLLICSV